MEGIIELKDEETVASETIALGFIGWGPFSQGFHAFRARQSQTNLKGWVYPTDNQAIVGHPWQSVLELDTLFHHAHLIFIEASYEELKLLFPRIRLLVSDAHVLVFLGSDISFRKITQHINEHKLIRCLRSPVRHFRDVSLVYTVSDLVTPREVDQFCQVLEGLPVVLRVDTEIQLEALHGLVTTGPAIGYAMIDALADGVLKMQIPRKTGLLLAAHILSGAARTFLETEIHPGVLRDQSIAQPGLPLSGLMALEKAGLRGIMVQAVETAAEEAQKKSQSK